MTTITLQPTEAPDTASLVRRIIAELDANPGAREPLLRALLTDEFLMMPARLTRVEENVGTLLEVPPRLTRVEEKVETLLDLPPRLTRVEEKVETLLDLPPRLTRVEEKVETLLDLPGAVRTMQNDVARLKGKELETDFAHSATSFLNRMFGFMRCQVVHGKGRPHSNIADQYVEQIAVACENGLITESQLRRLHATDVIARCRRPSDSATIWVAVEVAARMDYADIDRAAQSAAALRLVFDQDAALAVAAAERIDPPDRARAASAGVTLCQLAEEPPEPE